MEFNDLASVNGKSGLFKIVKAGRQGVILESLDENRKRMIAGPSQQVSILGDISIYTVSDENEPLVEVMRKIREEFGEDPGMGPEATSSELRAFMKHVLPEHDEERVYPSNIRKLINWYLLIIKQCPEVLDKKDEKRDEVDPPTQ
jgi:hypothetical protein